MTLREASEKSGVPKRNIHFYIKEGLLKPATDPGSGYYIFDESDCKKLLFIRKMRDAGLSVANISSLIHTPVTAVYYLNRHIKIMQQQQMYLEKALISMHHMTDELPIYPDFEDLYNICMEAQIPEPVDTSALTDTAYHAAMINHFLWAPFLPKTKFTEYQEFLWMKVNRQSLQHHDASYLQLQSFFQSLSSSQIDRMLSIQSKRYSQIAELSPDEYDREAANMIRELRRRCNDTVIIGLWNRYCENYVLPSAQLHASDLSLLVMELSPFYRRYVNNIGEVCSRVYQFLSSADGEDLARRLHSVFGDNLQLEKTNHGILEALVSLKYLPEYL